MEAPPMVWAGARWSAATWLPVLLCCRRRGMQASFATERAIAGQCWFM